ncbi:hypothetical protein RIF29_25218 [Crotalaria pallida]|uniref:Uncharacterized protein n=1 Tax=Crotalaria pallida TaxID=3830 RepID=A0AAN9ETD6_CROPI
MHGLELIRDRVKGKAIKENDGGMMSSQAMEKENVVASQSTPVDTNNSQPVQITYDDEENQDTASELVKDLIEEEVVVIHDTNAMANSAGEKVAGCKAGAIVQSGAADSNVPGVDLVESAGTERQEDDHDAWTPIKTRRVA